jgi:Transglycosylase SLT domain
MGAPGSAGQAARAIGDEAGELKTVASLRGWWGLAQHLENVEAQSRQAPHVLTEAVAALARRLALGEPAGEASALGNAPLAPPRAVGPASIALPRVLDSAIPPGSIALPPMVDDLGASRVVQPAGPSPAAPVLPRIVAATEISARARPSRPPEGRAVESPSALPEPRAKPAVQPRLLVKDMLGLQAFGKSGAPEKRPDPRPAQEPPPARGLLGLGARGQASAAPPYPPANPAQRSHPLLARFGAKTSTPSKSANAPAGDRRSARRRDASSKGGLPTWFVYVGGGVALLAVSVIALVLWPRPGPPPIKAPGAATPSRDSGKVVEESRPASDPAAQTRLKTTEEVHEFGTETPEMRELIDQQSRCANDTSKCSRRWTAYVNASPAAPITLPLGDGKAPPLSSWLLRLKTPESFPLRDDPLLKGPFEYDAKNMVGRAQFQQRLFRCSAYQDIVESTLIKYGAPSWLFAVAYQESGCDPVIESPVGAKGMWQFMPESARAYGLHVVEDEVDGRLSPCKSTEAAIHFLADLQRKVGSWDLALAAYNMGPYGLVARMARVSGGRPGFWDLAHAGLLPDETARYVPAIEAHALVLRNLVALDFSGGGAPPEDCTEIVVKPGTRLSLVARAARTSTRRIGELNRDFLQATVPNGETAIRIPSAEAHLAESFLQEVAPNDKRDTCVPAGFDWGTVVFEASPYAKNCGQAGPAP